MMTWQEQIKTFMQFTVGAREILTLLKRRKKITAKQGTVGAKEIFTPYTSKEHIYKSNV